MSDFICVIFAIAHTVLHLGSLFPFKMLYIVVGDTATNQANSETDSQFSFIHFSRFGYTLHPVFFIIFQSLSVCDKMNLYGSSKQHPQSKGVITMFFFFFFLEFPNILSERLTHAMEKMNMDVSTLALLVGASVVTVKRWLNGTYQPRHVNLPKLICALQVPADYLCIE